MIILLLFFVLAVISALHNLSVSDMNDVLIASIFAAFSLSLYIYFNLQHKKSNKFLQFLFDNKNEVNGGFITYNGVKITPDTVVVQYVSYISVIIVSIQLRSSFMVSKGLRAMLSRVIYTLFALVFGWWSLPRGPIHTIGSVMKNIKGGYRYKVRDLITMLEEKSAEKVCDREGVVDARFM